jgi:hypothetical protein
VKELKSAKGFGILSAYTPCSRTSNTLGSNDISTTKYKSTDSLHKNNTELVPMYVLEQSSESSHVKSTIK